MTKYGSLLPSQHFPPAKVLDILPAFLGMKVSEKVSQTPHRPAPPLSPRPPIFLAVATSAAETAANNARSAAAGSRSVTIRSRLQTVRDRSVAIRSRLRTVRNRSVAVRSRSRTVRNRAETTAFRAFFPKDRVLSPKTPFPTARRRLTVPFLESRPARPGRKPFCRLRGGIHPKHQQQRSHGIKYRTNYEKIRY